ncbi:unnamed protein product [Orchesella dallaii]|uniref:Centrosomal protein kizuna n=1 Tax=Orchesella dallaii TaxID=48710 RepID=A0ABP1QUD7_9HEXA
MLTSRNGVDGDVGGGTFVGTFGDGNMDGLQVAGTSASSIGDSLITFSPLKDAELRRRARNNDILAKIQELEANACVQAARSERLRMMREEYETLVRKYASPRKWNVGSWNGSNGYHQNAYQPCNSQQRPFISPTISTTTAPPPAHPLTGTSMGSSQLLTFQPTRDIGSNINPTFSTAGVNTDITGPVRPIMMMETGQSEENDLQCWSNGAFKLKHEKVKIVVESGSQTEQLRPNPGVYSMMPLLSSTPSASIAVQPQASTSSSTSFLHEEREHNGKMVVAGKCEQESSENDTKKNLSAKMEMMMMLEEEEEDDDDESLLEAGRKTRRKQQLQQLQQHPEAVLDNTVSISFTETPTTSKDLPEDVPTPRQRQQKKNWNSKNYKTGLADDESSGDTTTTSLAPARKKADDNDEDFDDDSLSKSKGRKDTQFDMSDPSFSDSISAFQSHQRQRKLLLQQLSVSKTSNLKNKGRTDENKDSDNLNGSATDEEDGEERSVIRARQEKGLNDQEDQRHSLLLSPNTTSACGATSESIEDSLMDSIHKTPDTLPKDDSELHGIAEVNEEDEQEQEEIELDNSSKLSRSRDKNGDDDDDDEDWRIPATAGESKDEGILTQSGVNDKTSDRTGTSLNGTKNGIKEFELNAQINDAEEIRSNNLSSSKLDVPAEEENSTFTHANNRVENDDGEPSQQQQKDGKEKKNSDPFYGDVEQPMEHSSAEENVQSHNGQFEGKLIEQKDISGDGCGEANVSDKERNIISHSQAPSANMSAHSSSISSSSSGLNAAEEVNALQKELPPNRLNQPGRKSSTGSSSSASSSRQHSLDELVDPVANASKAKTQILSQNQKDSDSASHQQQSPKAIPTQRSSSSTLPQSAQKRHHQLQQQLRKSLVATKEGTPVGADNTPEHLSSTSPKSPAGATTQSAANIGDNNVTKGTGGAEKVSSAPSSQKTTKSSPTLATTSSPSSGRTGDKVGNHNGMTAGTTGSANGNGTTGPTNTRSPKTLKSATTKPGQTGSGSAQNTGRKMRLKLNYDDSESDSSEIAPIKVFPSSTTSTTAALTGNQTNMNVNQTNVGGQQQQSSINAGGSSTQQSSAANKPPEDDDFDDFFDI